MSRPDIRRAIRIGLLFGVIATSLSAIGMVEAFNERDIISGVLTFGQILLFSTPIIAGYAARPQESTKAISALASGVIAGIMTALPLLGLIAFKHVHGVFSPYPLKRPDRNGQGVFP